MKKSWLRLLIAGAVAGLGIVAPAAEITYPGNVTGLGVVVPPTEITSTWNVSSGNWGTAGNWSNNPPEGSFPNNGNGGFNYNAILANGGTITLDQGISIDSFTLSSGVLTGSNNLSLDANLIWTEGSMEGTGTTSVSGAASTISTNNNIGLGRVLNNTGTITDSNTGQMYFDDTGATPGVLDNSGTFDVTAAANFTQFSSSPSNAINNLGAWNVFGTGATTSVGSGIAFNNTGIVNVNNGTFAIAGAFPNSGTLQLGGGTFSGSSLVSNSGSHIYGYGAISSPVQLNSWAVIEPGGPGKTGTLNITGALTLDSTSQYVFNLDSTGGGAGNGASEIIATSVTLEAGSLFTFNDIAGSQGTLTRGTEFIAFQTADGITGAFANLPNDSSFTVGQNTYEATYSPDDLTITVVPEPATWQMIAAALGLLVAIRTPRKRPARTD